MLMVMFLYQDGGMEIHGIMLTALYNHILLRYRMYLVHLPIPLMKYMCLEIR